MNVTLVKPYDPAWPSQFLQISAFVKTGLDGVSHRVEHIGSTAIPGMMAKPIIDLDVVISPGTFLEAKAGLAVIGYIHQGDLGIPKRQAFDLVNEIARSELPPHHLYVCEDGVYELRKHLSFRDFMRQRPKWRERLNQLKVDLCQKHGNDRQAYINGKSKMVEKITALSLESSEQPL